MKGLVGLAFEDAIINAHMKALEREKSDKLYEEHFAELPVQDMLKLPVGSMLLCFDHATQSLPSCDADTHTARRTSGFDRLLSRLFGRAVRSERLHSHADSELRSLTAPDFENF
ncbi:hypothetical protein H351_31750 (plasmid) [Rhodococcus erythropolis R138]|nr:hypothetical protein H351_31750 [Rhodococcus erythropolis R138]